jgi:ubiquinone/menaquinone biosynthesis C-methylase UbiE
MMQGGYVSNTKHWENVYRTKAVDKVSWFQHHAESSLYFIRQTGLRPEEARVIDVGGGASVLVDDLLDAGYRHLTVLDISASALAVSQARLGKRAKQVNWLVGNITETELPVAAYDIWHDRAVFHFLTRDEDRKRYVEQVWRAVRPGGFVIVATFGPNGPLQCSDLDVRRYSSDALHGEFGAGYKLISHTTELHTTPAGKSQEFVYCFCRRSS